jgi:WD40 repeat protein
LPTSWANQPYPGQRALLAVGTASYDSPAFEQLDKVPDSLQAIVGALRTLGFTAAAQAPGYRLDPTLAGLRAAVREAAAAAPVVVLYYTGHGTDQERNTYYLVTKDSWPTDLSESALPARDLLRLFTVHDGQGQLIADQPTVLVILDCCYSGSAGMTMLEDALHGIGNPHTWMIASAGPLEYARQGLFAKAFRQVLERPTVGPSQRFVDPLTIVEAINDACDGKAGQQAWLFQPATGAARIPPFFPNPGFQAGLAGLTVADQQHWISRVRGGPEESTTGFYLTGKTGRLRAAGDLVAWMCDPGRHGLALVTGSPGTGKSALLALPTLLTERSWREDLLRAAAPGSLIARAGRLLPLETRVSAVHARGLNTDQAAGAIAHALGRQATSASGLLEALDITPQQDERVILVDAVDEATSPTTLLGGLLVPLSRQPGLRVAAGTRRHVLPDAIAADLIIDLDTSTYQDPQALADYVQRLLTAAEEPGLITPYQAGFLADGDELQAEITAEVAAAIAQQATARDGGPQSFLIGRLLALSARSREEPVDVTSEGWQSELPATVAEAFDEDLARLGDKQRLARILLAALAWAKGPGLPWENIWAPVARAIAAFLDPACLPVGDDDIRWLLGKAGAYVVEDLGSGERSAYRPFHDLLAAHLRGEPAPDAAGTSETAAWMRRRAGIEQVITDALLSTVPVGDGGQRDWLYAHPYLRTYLAQHAAAAGPASLAALVADMDFLSVADPVTLITLLSPAVRETRELARTYRRARPLLGDDPAANAAYLQEAARALTSAGPTRPAAISPLYRTRLAAIRRDDSLLTLAVQAGPVLGVAFAYDQDGSLLLAAVGESGIVRVWDPLTGAPVGAPLTTHPGGASSVAFGTDPAGRLLLASVGSNGAVRVWDLLTGTQQGKRLSHGGDVSSLALGAAAGGRLLLASGSSRGAVHVWDPLAGGLIGEPFFIDIPSYGHRGGVPSVAFGAAADGRLLLASGGSDGWIHVRDPLTRGPIGEPFFIGKRFDPPRSGVSSLAFGVGADGRLLLASGGSDGVQVWDPLTGTKLGKRLSQGGDVSSLALGAAADGRLLLVSGGSRGTVRVWDPVSGRRLDRQLTGHTGDVSSVAFGLGPGGRLLLASGDSDGTVRVWDPLSTHRLTRPLVGHTNVVYSVALGSDADGHPLLASGGDDGKVRLWDPLSGAPRGGPLSGHTGRVLCLAFGGRPASQRRIVLASGGSDGTIRLWDPPAGDQPAGASSPPVNGRADRVLSVAVGSGLGHDVLLAFGGSNGTVVLWDPTLWGQGTFDPLLQPLVAHQRGVSSVAFGGGPDARMLASASEDGTIRLWPLTSGRTRSPTIIRTDQVLSVTFGALGRFLLLATGAANGTVQMWNPARGSKFGPPLTGHTGRVNSVAFATDPNGRALLASGSDDHTMRLWDVATGSAVAVLRRRSSIYSVAATGTMLAIGDAEGVYVIELIDLPRPTG